MNNKIMPPNKVSMTIAPLVGVTAEFAAYHYWKDAPDDVKFLRDPHRHLFKVTVEIATAKDADREFEFFTLKQQLTVYLRESWEGKVFPDSCESIAKKISMFLVTSLGVRSAGRVFVWEDGENYGAVEFSVD